MGQPTLQVTATDLEPKRIVLTTFGTLGDLHPFLAIGLGLRARGHEVVIGTGEAYRRRVEGLGLGFAPIPPDMPEEAAASTTVARMMDSRKGSEHLIREFLMPALRPAYEATLEAAAGADLLVSHYVTFATRLVAERTGIAWASTVMQPLVFYSRYDPPVFGAAAFTDRLRQLGPNVYRPLIWLLDRVTIPWSEPWRALRAEIGLPPSTDNPITAGQHAPALVLALFSAHFARAQPDWPPQTIITGFPFFDEDGDGRLPDALARFLAAGPPPVVFTLGSIAVLNPGRFYVESAAAARALGRRAVLVGPDPGTMPGVRTDDIIAVPYAPYHLLFPHAAAIVHQGGIGTTAQALRAGKPMLVVPFAHDQPDNAYRAVRLGVARTVTPRRYTAARAARALGVLLNDPGVARRAADIGVAIRREDGVAAACDALEGMLRDERAPVTARVA